MSKNQDKDNAEGTTDNVPAKKLEKVTASEAVAHMKTGGFVENSATGELCRSINYRGVDGDGVEMTVGVDLSRLTVKDFLSVVGQQPLFKSAGKWPS